MPQETRWETITRYLLDAVDMRTPFASMTIGRCSYPIWADAEADPISALWPLDDFAPDDGEHVEITVKRPEIGEDDILRFSYPVFLSGTAAEVRAALRSECHPGDLQVYEYQRSVG